MNALGDGSFSSALNVATLPPRPDAPQFVGFTNLTANSVRIQWARPDPPSTSASPRLGEEEITPVTATAIITAASPVGRAKPLYYTLQLSQDADPEWIVIYEGTETSYKATRLQENSSYSFRVCASNVSGPGVYSTVRTITTPRLPPPVVRGKQWQCVCVCMP
ncbi:unnamed protein product [Echinostoma caproni]|uniref:Fibronectin type-III domain-containing protein n=1 Tax=Echinostoma caproni TaxID=27848 RepID=A0A3P8LE49_9TREM|nr:unnamed protein product [Echinostoma caproni]